MTAERSSLYTDFIYPPFSILDARSGWWRARKRAWLNLGFQSEQGRKPTFESLTGVNNIRRANMGEKADRTPKAWENTSIFDPVLCELMYRWFCPPGGTVLDPFSGGVVRGIIAGILGHPYRGFDIRREQIDENVKQAGEFQKLLIVPPDWRHVDACGKSIYRHCMRPVDFIFTCPPYGDLEVYSDLPGDISTMPFATFAGALSHSIETSAQRLKPDRFAAFVVSDIRDKEGRYRCLPDIVRSAGKQAGLDVYAEIVLATNLATLPLRVRGQFTTSRKVGRAHQSVILFVKGDAKTATAAIGAVPCKYPFLNSILGLPSSETT